MTEYHNDDFATGVAWMYETDDQTEGGAVEDLRQMADEIEAKGIDGFRDSHL